MRRAPADAEPRGEGAIRGFGKQRRACGLVQAGDQLRVVDGLVQLLGKVLYRLVLGDGQDLRSCFRGRGIFGGAARLQLVGISRELDVHILIIALVAGDGTGDETRKTSGGNGTGGCRDNGNAPFVGGLLAVLATLLCGVEHVPSSRSCVGHFLLLLTGGM